MHTPSNGGSNYAVGFVEDHTNKSDVHFIKKLSDLFGSLKFYKERSEKVLGRRLMNILLGGAGKNTPSEIQ